MNYYVPEKLRLLTQEIEVEGITLLRNGHYSNAENKFRIQLKQFHQWEFEYNLRIHKGGPFHNLGVSLLYQGESSEALRFLILAYIEDMIGSLEKGSCDNLPASRALRGLCGVAQEQLRNIDDILLNIVDETSLKGDITLHETIYSGSLSIITEIIKNYEKYLSDTWNLDIEGQKALQKKAFSTASKIYKIWYKKLLEYQNQVSMRVHKGTPIYNIGLSLFLIGDDEAKTTSKRWFLYSHIENVLSSQSLIQVESELSYMVLKTQLGFSEVVLKLISNFAFKQKGESTSYEPDAVLSFFINENSLETLISLLIHLPKTKKKKKIEIYKKLFTEKDSNKKGQLLVDLLNLMIRTDVNFDVGKIDVRTETEQMDMELHNKAIDPFLRQMNSMVIIVECKNWSTNVGSNEIRDFVQMVQNRPRVICNVGILITTSKFTEPAKKELLRQSGSDYVVVTIDGEELEKAVKACLPFSQILKNSLLSAGRR